MRSIGDVRDDFVRQARVWYERHKIGRVVLDGTQTTGRNGQTETFSQYYCTITDKAFGKTNMICNKFTTNQSLTQTYQIAGRDNNNGVYFNLALTDCEYTVDGVKAWLETNLPEVIYELAEPTLTECTSEQVEQLENIVKAKSYNGVTNIYSNDVVVPYLSCVALKNI